MTEVAAVNRTMQDAEENRKKKTFLGTSRLQLLHMLVYAFKYLSKAVEAVNYLTYGNTVSKV